MTAPSSDSRDISLAYMGRFGCIGPACEDNCCHTWRVDVNEQQWDRLIEASRLAPHAERQRLRNAVMTVEQNGAKRRVMKLRVEDGGCVMLEPDGNCHLQRTFGHHLLWDVCMIYPRSMYQIGDHLEMTATTSCPEVARQLLLHSDATEVIDFPHERAPRIVRVGGLEPRDMRPYWRRALTLRDRFIAVLRRRDLTLEERLLVVSFFAKRTAEILQKETKQLDDADEKALAGELDRLADSEGCRAIARRFASVQPPSFLVLLLAREIMRPALSTRDNFRQMAETVFGSYVNIELALKADSSSNDGAPVAHVDGIFGEYQRRKAALRALLAARVDQYFGNHAIDFWMHHLPLGAPELMTLSLRQLGQMAVHKFLLYSHPRIAHALADGRSDAELQTLVDATAVEVFYRCARHIEHSPLLSNMEKALEKRGLRSLAGATALVRF